MEWELSKENVQPMKSGRNVEILNDALKAKADGHARSNIFENQRRQMLDAIEHYSGDDPLQPWIRCIKWIKDAYPAGGAQSELLKLLEGCTRTFQKEELYRNDVRYLRIWVQYADCCSDPSDVFAFLESNEVGQAYALFYEAYATSMEVRRNFAKADEIYRTGIARQAQPLGRLENMYRNFLNRMVRRGERKIREEQQLVENGTTVNNENQFRAFGPTSHFSGSAEQQYGRDRGRQMSVQNPPSRSNRPKNAKISVFVDPEFEVSRSSPDLYGDDPGPSSHHSVAWCHLPGEADKKKENFQQPTKWTEAKIEQNLPFSRVTHSGLDVYVDEEFSEASNRKGQPKPATAAAPPIMKLRLEDMQSLKRTSPRLKGSFLDLSSTALVSATKNSESPGVIAGQEAAHHPKASVPRVLAYDAEMINESGLEKCFEEVRLEVWNERSNCVLEREPDGINVKCKNEEGLEPLADVQDSEKTVQLEGQDVEETATNSSDFPTPIVVETQKGTTVSGEDPSSYDGAVAPRDENQPESNDHPVDVSANGTVSGATESTYVSEQSLEGSLPFLCSSDRPYSVSNSFSMQGDETIAIKRFADEIIVLGADPRVNGLDAGSHQGLVDPTINTKECLADILDMFNKPLESDKSRSKARVPRDTKKRSTKSGGFQVFVDEDLQTQRVLRPNKDEKRVKPSSHSFGAAQSQSNGFQVYVDENLGGEGPVQCRSMVADTRSSTGISRKSNAEADFYRVIHDENFDLQTERTVRASEDEKRVKASSSSFGVVAQNQDSGFQVYAHENLGGEGPVSCKASVADARYAKSTSRKSKAEAGSFQVFQDENLAVQPARPQQSQKRMEILKSSVSRSKDFQIFVDDEYCNSMSNVFQHEERVENSEPSPVEPMDLVSQRITYRIYEDEEMKLDPSKSKEIETRVNAPSNRSSTSLGVFVDEEFRDLSLTASPPEDEDKLPQQKPVSVEDENVVVPDNVLQAPSSPDVSSPAAATKCSMNGALVEDKGTLHASPERTPSVNCSCMADVANGAPVNPVIPMKVEETPITAFELVKVDPWDEKILKWLLFKIQSSLYTYEGFSQSNTKYSGSMPTSSVRASNGRNKIIELGSSTYRLKRCVGEGAFAHVFEAEDVDDDFFDDPPKIALKFQKPACPWEFYIYRQLDERISKDDRRYYGYVRKMHLYTDCSFMICDYGEKGTLQDVVNAYLALNQRMEENLCMFYTIEMLRMLEVLHSVGIIHGDIKPDNFLIRDQDDSLELEDWGPEHPGCWKSQGLCLIDWGRSIDVTLFPDGTMFHGDCKTDSFRCPEMLERRPWTFQVDTFGLCGVVHCLLHGSYMQIEKLTNAEGQTVYRPKATFKRYWNVKLWKELFDTLLNVQDFSDRTLLTRLRQRFECHLTENNLGRKIRALISKQTIMMFTSSRR